MRGSANPHRINHYMLYDTAALLNIKPEIGLLESEKGSWKAWEEWWPGDNVIKNKD